MKEAKQTIADCAEHYEELKQENDCNVRYDSHLSSYMATLTKIRPHLKSGFLDALPTLQVLSSYMWLAAPTMEGNLPTLAEGSTGRHGQSSFWTADGTCKGSEAGERYIFQERTGTSVAREQQTRG